MMFFFQLFSKEITELCKQIRKKPFQSFVVVGLSAVIAILYKSNFLYSYRPRTTVLTTASHKHSTHILERLTSLYSET